MHYARREITDAMRFVAEREEISPETIWDEVAAGRLIIPANVRHLAGSLEPMCIGKVAAFCAVYGNTTAGRISR
jgi:phosphomethylpyrimidine synthase